MPDRLLTAPQLADRWQISRQYVYVLLVKGLPSVKIGSARRFDPEACDRWLAAEQGAA